MPHPKVEVLSRLQSEEVESLTLLNGLVLVKRDPPETMVGSLIVIPKAVEKRRYEPTQAVVMKIGKPDRTDKGATIPNCLKVGDRVVLDKFAGHDVAIEGDDDGSYVIVAEADVLCVLDPAPVE